MVMVVHACRDVVPLLGMAAVSPCACLCRGGFVFGFVWMHMQAKRDDAFALALAIFNHVSPPSLSHHMSS